MTSFSKDREAVEHVIMVFGPIDDEERRESLLEMLITEGAGSRILHSEAIDGIAGSARATGILDPDFRICPHTLYFDHFIPTLKGEKCSDEEIQRWRDRLLKRLNSNLVHCGLAKAHMPEITWVVDRSSSSVMLVCTWRKISTKKCLTFGRVLEEAYRSERKS